MLNILKTILEIQELDMKMIRLMRLKKQRQEEIDNIESIHKELREQLVSKEESIEVLNKNIFLQENKIHEIKDHLKKLEAKQGTIKKVEEFNALTHELSSTERERVTTEQMACDLIDKKNAEEEVVKKIKDSLQASEESSKLLKKDILENIKLINEEGKSLLLERQKLVQKANPDIFKVYSKLLNNKKDRVVVPIENRICSGCHIALTAQHENLVRKCERLVFCEHCSRILYWQESEKPTEGQEEAPKKRRRRIPSTTS